MSRQRAKISPRPPCRALVSIDPGLNNPGVAVFLEGQLKMATRVPSPRAWADRCTGERCRLVGENILQAIKAAHHGDFDVLATEYPFIYPKERDKDPNDLPPMVGVSLYAAGALRVPCVESYLPREWLGGNTSKETQGSAWDTPRGQRAREALSEGELACVELSHDAIDALCVGLYYLGRFEFRRLYPGST